MTVGNQIPVLNEKSERMESIEESKRPLVARMRMLRYKVGFGGALRPCAEQTGQGISPDRLRKSHRSELAALSANSAMAFFSEVKISSRIANAYL